LWYEHCYGWIVLQNYLGILVHLLNENRNHFEGCFHIGGDVVLGFDVHGKDKAHGGIDNHPEDENGSYRASSSKSQSDSPVGDTHFESTDSGVNIDYEWQGRRIDCTMGIDCMMGFDCTMDIDWYWEDNWSNGQQIERWDEREW